MHKPGTFVIVSQDESGVGIHAMCICGDEDCGWYSHFPTTNMFTSQDGKSIFQMNEEG